MGEASVSGPIQVFVIGFEEFEASGEILAALRRARKRGVIRLADLLFIRKDNRGNVTSAMHLTDLSEAERERLGAVAVAERDYGLNVDQLHNLADNIPASTSCRRPPISSWAGVPHQGITTTGANSKI